MTSNTSTASVVYIFLLITGFLCSSDLHGQQAVKQGPPVPAGFCISPGEMELYRLINDYRKMYSLPPVPLSVSLSYVAAMHARDLFLHHPDRGACNFHSWSDKGTWKPFCYPGDETKKTSVWDKPREMTRYPSKAYEIVYWENNPLVRDTVIMVWKTEEYFNNFLLNSGKWQGRSWNAIGIAVYENYACAWFGEVTDPQGEVTVCGAKPVKQVRDTVKTPVKTATKPAVKPADSTSGIPASSSSPKDSITGVYYIIVKTNLTADASDKLSSNLKAGDFPDARVLYKDGKIRVSVFETTDKATAMAKLKEVKKIYRDAWLLKR